MAFCYCPATHFICSTATSTLDIYIQHNTADFDVCRMWSHKTFLNIRTGQNRHGQIVSKSATITRAKQERKLKINFALLHLTEGVTL